MEFVVELIVAALAAALLRTFGFMFVVVKGSSMRETLRDGDMLLATKPDALLGKIRRGRVVICHYPGSRKRYIKRLTACPGDTVMIRDGVTYINGAAQTESYIAHRARLNFGPLTLNSDEYFVLGDNRANSLDSRAVGPICKRQFVAVVHARVWPISRIGKIVARDGE